MENKIRIDFKEKHKFELFNGRGSFPITLNKRNDKCLSFGEFIIADMHDQDCCEHVYADWDCLKDTTFFDEEFDYIEIEKVDDVGFKINGYTVNCYNIQDGYYNSLLDVVIVSKPMGVKTEGKDF